LLPVRLPDRPAVTGHAINGAKRACRMGAPGSEMRSRPGQVLRRTGHGLFFSAMTTHPDFKSPIGSWRRVCHSPHTQPEKVRTDLKSPGRHACEMVRFVHSTVWMEPPRSLPRLEHPFPGHAKKTNPDHCCTAQLSLASGTNQRAHAAMLGSVPRSEAAWTNRCRRHR
jgi:hypothetical protein